MPLLQKDYRDLLKHQYLLNENVLNKKLEHFYNILKKSVDMKIYIFILYYMYVMSFRFLVFLLKNLYIYANTHCIYFTRYIYMEWKKTNQVKMKNTGIAIKIVFELKMVFIVFYIDLRKTQYNFTWKCNLKLLCHVPEFLDIKFIESSELFF